MPDHTKKEQQGSLKWWQLSLLGVGFTTGSGFFLGSGLAIEKSGFSVLLLFLIAAFGIFFVFDALARMIAQQSEKGSFKAYSQKAFGHWAGFSHGWMYWLSEMLILGSQLTALGVFTRFWFPRFPLWMIASIYALLGIGIVFLGNKVFQKAENIFAVVKISALVMFIILACLVFPGVLGKENAHMHEPQRMADFFSHGIMGMWTALIFVFFAFAGIEVMGLMATELKNPKDATKSGKAMILTITLLFILSIGLAMLLAPLDHFSPDESPFVTAFKELKFNMVVHIFNGVLIIAGFSSLVASLFSTTKIMHMIAKDGDAPQILTKQTKRKIPIASLGLTVCGLVLSILMALLLPKKVYEYITTAAGLMLIYTWLFMIFASRKLLKLTAWGQIKSWTAVLLILITTSGTLFDERTRPGFFASLAFIAMIGIVTFFMRKRWNKKPGDSNKIALKRPDTRSTNQTRLGKSPLGGK